jgi:hypothetical protein
VVSQINRDAQLKALEAMFLDPNFEDGHVNLTMLKQDVATRFNYVKMMMQSVVRAREAIAAVIKGDPSYKKDHGHLLLTDEDISMKQVYLGSVPFFYLTFNL